MPAWVIPAIIGGIVGGSALYSGYRSKRALEQGGNAARDAAYSNADDLRNLAGLNSAGYLEAGAVNAAAIRNVGDMNATAIERETLRNMLMYGLQAGEDRRRFVINQRRFAGGVRAASTGSGLQANTGSPLHFLNAQVDLSIRERRYGDIKTYWSLRNMQESGDDRAFLTRYTAEQQASVVEFNSALQAELSYAEAMNRATAMERSGDLAKETAGYQASAAMWQGVSNGIAAGVGMYSSLGGTFPSIGAGSITPGTTIAGTGNYGTVATGWNSSGPSVGFGWGTGGSLNSPFIGFTPAGTTGAY